MIRHVGSPTCIVHADVTLTQSKVKVMGLLNFWKLHFSRSISSAILVWSWKLMVVLHSMGPSLQLVGAWVLNFLLKKLSRVQTLLNFDITRILNGHISLLLEATVTCLGMLVVLYVLRMLIWPWPDPRSRSLTFRSSANCTFLRLSAPPFWPAARNWLLIMTVRDLVYIYSEQISDSPPVGGHVTPEFVKCWYHQNSLPFISTLAEVEACDCDCT